MRKSICSAVVFFIVLTGCQVEDDETGPEPGEQKTYTADGISFIMIAVPAKTFPGDNSDTHTVADPFWLAETETTYELWDKVYVWGRNNGYQFAGSGARGGGTGTKTVLHPVTDMF
jgi:hypothetical protein